MTIKIKRDKVLELLSDGWQLGMSTTILYSSAWMQKRLMCGGDSFNVHLATLRSMEKRGQIVQMASKRDDPFWIIRYGLPK